MPATLNDYPRRGSRRRPGAWCFHPRLLWRAVVGVVLAATARSATAAEPIGLHPDNPHYFLFRGKPTVLITSGEHYGAVLNLDFDYRKYLATLESHGFNLTRVFSGAYCENPGAFGIADNTLAPARGRLICPWARSETPGYAGGGNKFDLRRWDPAYFKRLGGLAAEASRRGIVVEVVLFCPFYKESMWKLSPMNAANNVNGIGKVQRKEAYTLKEKSKKLLAAQDAMVRKIVPELKDFDNVYYEICNEPYFGAAADWQGHIAETIVRAEAKFPASARHLIAQNIANKSKKIRNANRHVSLFNFHYARPSAVSDNYGLNKAIGDDETGFRGSAPGPYRIEGWSFLLAGGALYNNLDYSFTCGHEEGTAKIKAPGGGGPGLRKQLEILKDFIHSFDFIKMKPDASVIKGGVPAKAGTCALVEPGRAYAIYVNGGTQAEPVLQLPAGSYKAEWVNTKTGRIDKDETFRHGGGNRTVRSPEYAQDIALRIKRAHAK